MYYSWSIYHDVPLDSYCYYDRVNYSFKAFHISFFVTSFALPVCLIILMYIVMLSRLWTPTIRTSK